MYQVNLDKHDPKSLRRDYFACVAQARHFVRSAAYYARHPWIGKKCAEHARDALNRARSIRVRMGGGL